jgi:protein-tyrosine-phosphatase
LTNRTLKQTLAGVVPSSLRRERATILRLGATAGPIYARLRLLDSLGIRPHTRSVISPGARSFLFICFGNIMRSPMAEALFHKSMKESQLSMCASSAGLHAVAGTLPDPRALTVAEEMEVSLSNHRAQLLTPELAAQADVILCMDYQNTAELLALYPSHREKILMLSAFAKDNRRHGEIPDPYLGNLDATRDCYAFLQLCVDGLTSDLKALTSQTRL